MKILSNNLYDVSPNKAPECPSGEGSIKSLYSFINQEKPVGSINLSSTYYTTDSIYPIWLGTSMRENGIFLISSYQNGINYGKLTIPKNN